MKFVNGSTSGQSVSSGPVNMEPQQSIQFDAGPITVIVDGRILRQERSAPLYLLGDASGQAIPITTLIPIDGKKDVTVIEGPDQIVSTLSITVIRPVPPLRQIRAAHDTPQHGLSTMKQQAPPPAEVIPAGGISGVEVYGYNQNISVLDANDYTFSDGISRCTWGAGQYEGQTAYLHADWESPAGVKWLGGNITFNDWVFDEAGWQAFRKIAEKTQWQHNFYGNKRAPGKKFILNRCTFSRPSSIGAKLMGDAVLNDPIFYLCAIGVQSLYGTVTLNNPIFYRPSYHTVVKQGSGLDYIGGCAVDAYTPTVLNNPLFIGGPADERLPVAVDPIPYNIGMISLNKTHSHYTDVVGASVTISGNARAYGWPFKSGTQSLYNGDMGRLSGSVVVKSTLPKAYNPQPLFDKLYNGSISRVDFNAKLRSDLLSLESSV